MSHPIIIIGSGLAAYNLARELRKLDTATPLTVISRDHAGFYSKPMLSNALAGNKSVQQLVMKSAETMASELNATILAQTEISAIDAAAQTVTINDGRVLPYRDLVLALGADPIRLPLSGNGAAGVMSVNDLDDFAKFSAALEGVKTVAILGAGLIGCEFANDLLARGIKPVVLDPSNWPLSRLLPAEAGERLAAKLTEAGVEFKMGVSASAVDTIEQGYALTLSDGSIVTADLVLSAVGLRSRTQLAAAAGLTINRGIVVDRQLQSSAAHIYAVGDCAEVAGLTLPFVLPIMQQARALAATLAGTPTVVKYPAMPVVVKTPACPTVVAPPAIGAEGDWQVDIADDGITARFVGSADELLGFALIGAASSQRQAMAQQLPPVLV